MRRPWVAALAALAVTLVLLAFFRQRPVEVKAPPGGADPACSALADRLPETVGGQPRRTTSASSPAVAAWGDPAIVWLCGTRQPGPSADCLDVSGVDWIVAPLKDGTAFTTYGRDPAVQVLVPRAYAPEPLLLPPFSTAVSSLAQGGRRCS